MKIFSALAKPITVQCFRRRPLQFEKEEIVYPNRYEEVPPGESEFPDVDVAPMLELYGRTGIVIVGKDEPAAEVEYRAKRLRYEFLTRNLQHYRQSVDQQVKRGVPVSLPSVEMQDLVREYKKLKPWVLANDPVLREIIDLPNELPSDVPDPMAESLREFGINPQVMQGSSAQAAPIELP